MAMIGMRLKELRKSRKILQKDIAVFLSIPLRTYQSYEYGEAEPNLDSVIKLADYFDVTADYLLGRSDDSQRR